MMIHSSLRTPLVWLVIAGLGTAGVQAATTPPITKEEVLAAERAWGESVIEIGRLYQSGGDYRAAAERLVDTLYGYGEGPVLFKPTKAAVDEFRETRE
ncbi:MAG: hypothetical protein ACUVQI_07975, partial [Thermochromatium sp.]